MWKRLGCTCCDSEDSYDLQKTPVYETKTKDHRGKKLVWFVDNTAVDIGDFHLKIETTDVNELSQPTGGVTGVKSKVVNGKHLESRVKSPASAVENFGKETETGRDSGIIFPVEIVHFVAATSSAEYKENCSTAAVQERDLTKASSWSSVSDLTAFSDLLITKPSPQVDVQLVNIESLTITVSDLSDKESNIKEMAENLPPKLTKPAPDFRAQAVVNGEFKEISLSDYKGKYLVLFFYPLDFTFVCPTEIIAFSDRVEEFRNIKCEVVACSTDSHFSHLAWVNTPRRQGGLGDMNIPLLADKTCSISKSYGVYKEDEGVAFRGLFIIDGKGNLRQMTINDLPVGRSVDETLRLVQAFQFTDKYGEVCPAGWKPGQDSMKPDPKGSKEYFSKKN